MEQILVFTFQRRWRNITLRVISKWTPESDASTETADQIRRLISFPVPLELRFGETTISRKFFLQQFPPNFFSFSPNFFSFLTRLSMKPVF